MADPTRPRVHIQVIDGTPTTARVFVDGHVLPFLAADIKIRADNPVEATITVDDVSIDIVAGVDFKEDEMLDEPGSTLPDGVSTYVKHVITSQNPSVIASVYQAITGEMFGRCRWHTKAHDWKRGSVLSDSERMVREISYNCRRCGVAFSVHANGKTERWQVPR